MFFTGRIRGCHMQRCAEELTQHGLAYGSESLLREMQLLTDLRLWKLCSPVKQLGFCS